MELFCFTVAIKKSMGNFFLIPYSLKMVTIEIAEWKALKSNSSTVLSTPNTCLSYIVACKKFWVQFPLYRPKLKQEENLKRRTMKSKKVG